MFKKLVTAALVVTQTLVPVYAFSAQDRFYYRYGPDGTHALLGTTTPGNGNSGSGGNTGGDPGTGTGGNPDQTGPIPAESLSAVVATAGGSSVSTPSPASILASISSYLSGGVSAVVFDSALPGIAGLTFNKATGVLSGTPTVAFDGNVNISYHDNANRIGVLQVPLTVYPHPILTSSKDVYELPTSADAASYNIKAVPGNNGFYAGVTYSLAPGSDALPAGLTLDNGTVVGSTVVTVGSTFDIVVRGTSLADASVHADKAFSLKIVSSNSLSLDLQPDTPLVWTLDTATRKVVDQQEFDPAPKPLGVYTAPLSWSVTDGPSWMHVDSYGQLTGTPPALGTYDVTVQVKDASANFAYDTASVKVTLPGYVYLAPGAQTFTVRAGETFKTATETVTNNVGDYTFNGESVPAGVILDSATGIFTGNFATANQYLWRLHVTDSDGRTDGDGKVSGTNYLDIVNVLPPVALAAATASNGGTQNTSPISVTWPKAANIIGKANYAVLGTVPGTLYYKVYDNNDSAALATYVSDSGSIRQVANETSAQTEARLAADHLVFDTQSLTLNGTPSKAGTFNLSLFVSDDHQDTGYTANSSDATRSSANSATSPSTAVVVAAHTFVATNSGNSETIAANTQAPTLYTALRDAASNVAWKDHSATWTLTSGTLPDGISATINQTTDVLNYTGYATTPGTYANIAWTVTDGYGNQVTTTPVTFTVGPRASLSFATPQGVAKAMTPGITDAALTVVASNIASGQQLALTDWAVAGALPDGVTYTTNANTLTFSGTSTGQGTFPVTVSAKDSAGGSASVALTFTVTASFRSLNLGGSNQQLAQYTGGGDSVIELLDPNGVLYTAGATWSLLTGTIPPGLTTLIPSNGSTLAFKGYPTVQGSFPNVTFQVTGADGSKIVTSPVSFTVGPRVALTLSTPLGTSHAMTEGTGDATLTVTASNTAHDETLAASNWVVSGPLPTGVIYTVSANKITFSGTSTVVGTYPVTVTATDSMSGSASVNLTFAVSDGWFATNVNSVDQSLTQYTSSPTLSTVLRVHPSNVAYTDGATWTLKSGTLPPGIVPSIASNGSSLAYVGFATAQGTYNNIVWTVTGADGNSVDTTPASFTVGPRLTLSLAGSPSQSQTMAVGIDSAAITVTPSKLANGQLITSDNWSVSGTLPTGVSYAAGPSGLVFSGKASKTGTFPVTVSAVDNAGGQASISLTFTVNAAFYSLNENGSNQQIAQYTVQPSSTIELLNTSVGGLYTAGASWSVYSGSLPPGITSSISADGSTNYMRGYATAQGTWTIVYQVTGADGSQILTSPETITVGPRQVLSLSTPNGTLNQLTSGVTNAGLAVVATNAANGTIAASGWSVTGLPTGVTYTVGASGINFTGKATTPGDYSNVVVKATDAAGGTSSVTLEFLVTASFGSLNVNGTSFNLAQYTSQPYNYIELLNGDGSDYLAGATWTVASGSLPPGVVATPSSDGSKLYFSGYASAQGTYSVVYLVKGAADGSTKLTDQLNYAVGAPGALTLSPATGTTYSAKIGLVPALTVTAANLPNGTAISASNWTVVGTLPPGVTTTTSASGVVFGGTPTTSGVYGNIVVTATDSLGRTATTTLTINVSPDIAFVYNGGSSLSVAQWTGQVTGSVNTRIGSSNKTWTSGGSYALTSGALPPGISYTSAADGSGLAFSGYATTVGTYSNVVFTFTDTTGNAFALTPYTFTVGPRAALTLASSTGSTTRALQTSVDDAALTIVPSNLAGGTAITAANWVKTTGTLPAGVTATAGATGLVFAGKPTAAGNFAVTYTATDSGGGTASITITFAVSSAASINTLVTYKADGTTTTTAQSFAAYTTPVTGIVKAAVRSSGTAVAVTWTLVSGTLPDGVKATPSADGKQLVYSGYATAVGTYKLVWIGVDANGNVATAPTYTITVTNRATLASTIAGTFALTAGVAGTGTVATGTVTPTNPANGDLAGVTWAVNGTVPRGVTWKNNNGVLTFSGTTTDTTGSFPITAVATDAVGGQGTVNLTFSLSSVLVWLGATQDATNSANITCTGDCRYTPRTEVLAVGQTPTINFGLKDHGNTAHPVSSVVIDPTYSTGQLPPGVVPTLNAAKTLLYFTGAPTAKGTYGPVAFFGTDPAGDTVVSATVTFQLN